MHTWLIIITYYVSAKDISENRCTTNSTYTIGQKKKRNIPIYFKLNYRTEMKLVPLIMDYCLLQFDGLNFFRNASAWGVSTYRLSFNFFNFNNFNFFNVNPQIFQRNRKVHLTKCLKTNFHNIFNISLRNIRRTNYS